MRAVAGSPVLSSVPRGVARWAAVSATVGGLFVAATGAQSPATDATAVLAAARTALGGEQRIAALTSFVVTGRTRQVQGDNLVPIEFEIACQLPDKCMRRDEIPARESGPTTSGFNGAELIQFPVPAARQGGPPAAAPGGPPPAGRGPGPSPEAIRAQRLAVVQQEFARLALGLFAGSIGDFPLTYSLAGEAESPQGKADVVDVKGPANFAARLFIFRETHLPIMLSWQAPGTPQTQGKPVETRIYYSDYRDVDGLKLPFRLRRAVGADTVEETTFDRFRLNAKVDPKKFEVKR
jgi:hypothetical protein